MKAMVFAAGLGTRLRPLTNTTPKAMVKVGGKPMLEHVISHLTSHGFNEIVINIHHFGQQIIDYLEANNNFGATIHISDERDELLETGGGILKARKWLDGDEPFLIHNADILTNLNLHDFYDYHMHHNADVTLLTKVRDTSRYLLCDSANRLHGWTNIKTGEIKPAGFVFDTERYHKLAYGCVQVVSPRIFSSLENYTNEHKFSIFPFYLSICERMKIMCYSPTQEYQWFDIGTPETLAKAESWIDSQR